MDIVTLNPNTFFAMDLVQNLNSVQWIERYSEPGEFEIRCEPTRALMEQLSLGTVISHLATREVMMVETHQIDESNNNESPELVVTGRSLMSFLENRIASPNNFSEKIRVDFDEDRNRLYSFPLNTTAENLTLLLKEHIEIGVTSIVDILPNTQVMGLGYTVQGDTPKEMVVRRGPLYPEVVRLLGEIDAGLKVQRPSQGTADPLQWVIYKGLNLDSVVFSSEYGDLEKTKYFWSNKGYKNSALVVGVYTARVVPITRQSQPQTSPQGLNSRVMYVDASDYDHVPLDTDADIATRNNILQRRGEQALAENRVKTLIETSISPNSRYKYRKDYNLGDTIYVNGNYGVSARMRVTEFAEFWDESGETGVPTVKSIY
jgi:hypothetical protein